MGEEKASGQQRAAKVSGRIIRVASSRGDRCSDGIGTQSRRWWAGTRLIVFGGELPMESGACWDVDGIGTDDPAWGRVGWRCGWRWKRLACGRQPGPRTGGLAFEIVETGGLAFEVAVMRALRVMENLKSRSGALCWRR